MRVDCLTRTSMYQPAFKFAFENGADFPFTQQYQEETYKKWVEQGSKGGELYATLRAMYEELNDWLNEHYLLYCCDMTHPNDNGSKEEVVLVVKKPSVDVDNNDYMYYHPDLMKDMVAAFWRL